MDDKVGRKNPYNSQQIYDCLRLMALEEMLKKNITSSITLYTSNQYLVKSVENLCRNLKIEFKWRRQFKKIKIEVR